MNSGKKFESKFKKKIKEQGIGIYRLPDSYITAKAADPDAFVMKNPADFLIHGRGILYFVELKSTNKNYITIAHGDKKGQIKQHQIDSLEKIVGEHEQGRFVLEFGRDTDKHVIMGINIHDFLRFMQETKKHSINPVDMAFYGGHILHDFEWVE